MPVNSRELSPPFLRLSLACLAACLSSSPEVSATLLERSYASRADAARSLFLAGLKLWAVMLEIDNREARKVETVMAVSFPVFLCRAKVVL